MGRLIGLHSLRVFAVAMVLACVGILAPHDAAAIQRGGSLGGGACESMETPDYGQQHEDDVEHIFSNFVYQYQKIIKDIFNQMYCGVREALTSPVGSMLTLFVTIFGAAILIGVTPFSARESMKVLFKIALISGFILQADMVIDVLYKGFEGFLTYGTDLVMKSAADSGGGGGGGGGGGSGGSVNGLLDQIDKMINKFLKSSAKESTLKQDDQDQCKASPVPMFVTLMAAAPPLFALAALMAFRLIMTFIRAVTGYLFALTLIMFLIVLSPIFLSLGLFRVTHHYFEQWIRYLASMSIQVVVVFAFIAFVMNMGIDKTFQKIGNLSVPFKDSMWQDGVRTKFDNVCTFCKDYDEESMKCKDDAAVPPSGMWRYPGALKFLGSQLFKLLLLAMLVDATLKMAPQVARDLGGARTAIGVAESRGDYGIPIAGLDKLEAAKDGAMSGVWRGGIPGMARGAYSGLMHGGDRSGMLGTFFGIR